MKASKGFLPLDLAVVFLVVGTLLFFISTSFGCCVKNLSYMQDVVEAKSLAENFWQMKLFPFRAMAGAKSEHSLQGNLYRRCRSLMGKVARSFIPMVDAVKKLAFFSRTTD